MLQRADFWKRRLLDHDSLFKSIFSVLVLHVHVEKTCIRKRAHALSQHERGQRMLAESNIACLMKGTKVQTLGVSAVAGAWCMLASFPGRFAWERG